jgi:hypothetical protein
MTQTIVCMKWGTRYPADYANRLWSMIKRNTRRPTRLVCYTDDVSGLDPGIEAYPLPPHNPARTGDLDTVAQDFAVGANPSGSVRKRSISRSRLGHHGINRRVL